jgi:hypothetical protein
MARPAWPAPITTAVVCITHVPRRDYQASSDCQASSTSTFFGLVTRSKTAERFCDWAISACRSPREASASMTNRTAWWSPG